MDDHRPERRSLGDAWEVLAGLLDYDAWANAGLIQASGGAVEADPGCRRLFAHLVGAQQVWLQRVCGEPWSVATIWPEWTVVEADRRRLAVLAGWRDRLAVERAADPTGERIVTYRTSRGEDRRAGVHAILRHVVNHGTHHRAQILHRLSAAGHAVPGLDMIVRFD